MSTEKNTIPTQFQITETVDQRHYLVGGALKEWKGNTTLQMKILDFS